jgi:UDP-N-acetylmuramoyl-tripeptide--D-alanyl-D-alanine ligase
LSFEITANNQSVKIELNVLGKHFAYAAAAACAVGLAFGLSLSEISRRLAGFKLPEGRAQLLRGKKGEQVIHDAYNANPASVAAALEVLSTFETNGKKIAVLGDMLELGSAEVAGHKEIGKVAARTADLLLAVGSNGKIIGDEAQKYMPGQNIYWLPNSEVAAIALENLTKEGDVVLVKGSKAMKMRKVVERLTDYKCEYE